MANANFSLFEQVKRGTFMIHILCYGDDKYKDAVGLNIRTALKYGADKTYAFSDKNIDQDFYNKNKRVLEMKRGGGYWLWKPYFINKVINDECNDGDWLIYSDSGLVYNTNIREYLDNISRAIKEECFVMRSLKFQERQYTKRDVFCELNCDNEKYTNSNMLAATVIVIKVCEKSRLLIAEWLKLSQNYHLITDEESIRENYPEFIENRHDQSLLSLVVKKNNAVYIDNKLFIDIIHMKIGMNPLLIYHHSPHGSYWRIGIDVVLRIVRLFRNKYIRREMLK